MKSIKINLNVYDNLCPLCSWLACLIDLSTTSSHVAICGYAGGFFIWEEMLYKMVSA